MRSVAFLLFRLGRLAAIVALVAAVVALIPRDGRGEEGDRAQVTAVRVGLHQNMTRLVFDLTAPVRYRVFTLGKPYRLVLDLPPVDWRLAGEMTMGQDGPVSAFRYGSFAADTNRVVIDLRQPVKVHKAFGLAPKGKTKSWRLVIDLEPITRDEFERLQARQRARSVAPAAGGSGRTKAVRRPAGHKRGPPVVVLDPGHGGVDRGATSSRGVHEKTIVLAFARALEKELLALKRYKVLLTRTGDYYVPLRRRYETARRAGADLFLSLHADSNPFRSTRGLSVYTLSEKASDKAAAALARRENRADIIAGVSLKGESNQVANILIDLAQRETMVRSGRFADLLVTSLRTDFVLLDRAHRYAGFAVLKAPDVPSVLVEIGYLTNRVDARLLASRSYHAKLSKGIARAIAVYFDSLGRSGRKTK